MRKPKALRMILVSLALLIPALALGVAVPHVGMDADADGVCNSPDGPDMGVWATAAEIGDTYSFDLFFEAFGDILSFGCIFCVKDSTKITNWSWSYGAIGGWTADAIKSGATVLPFVTLDLSAYPNAGCFQVQATDYTFSNPLSTSPPLVLGTFTYEVAGEGAIDWIVDESSSALDVSFMQIDGEDFCPDKTSTPPGDPLAIDDTPLCPLDDLMVFETWPDDVVFTATGGTGTYSWSATGLPPGMSIGEGTGEILGTADETGGFGFDVTVNDVLKESAVRHCSVFVLTPMIDDVTPVCPIANGQYGVPYPAGTIFQTESIPGKVGLVWTTDGLPDGMNIHVSDGEIGGDPMETGVFPFTVFLSDGIIEKIVYDDRPCQITVDPILIDDVTPASPLADGEVNVPYTPVTFEIVEPVGYIGSHAWGATGLPSGMSIASFPGVLSGTPTIAGDYNFTVNLYSVVDKTVLDTRDCSIKITEGGVDVNVVPPGTDFASPLSSSLHYFTVTNTGGATAAFMLSGWSSAGYPTTVTGDQSIVLGPGEESSPIEVVTVLPEIDCPTEGATKSDTVYLSATLTVPPKGTPPPVVYDQDSGITTIEFPAGVSALIFPIPGCQNPGEMIYVSYSVENTGYCNDVFTLVPTITGTGWSVDMDGLPVRPVDAGSSVIGDIRVTAPADACAETVSLTLTATGNTFGAEAKSEQVDPCTHYLMIGELSDEPDLTGLAGETVQYCFTVENTGPCSANYGVSATSFAWTSAVLDPDIYLNPTETGTICVSHEIPAGAVEGDVDSIEVVLTPYMVAKGDYIATNDTVVVRTTAIEPCEGDVDVYGGMNVFSPPGETLTTTFWVKNMSSNEDRFHLYATSDLGWNVWPETDIVGTLQPDEEISVSVYVEVPEDALCTDQSEVALWAVSDCDDTAMDADTALIGVMAVIDFEVVAITEDSTGIPDQTMGYMFHVTNNGNCNFATLVTRSGDPADWLLGGDADPISAPLGPGDQLIVSYEVTIPTDALQGDEHTLTVCAQLDDFSLAKTNLRPGPVCDSTITRVLSGCEHEQPILSLGDYQTVDYTGPNGLWTVEVKLINNGPGMAKNISMEMDHDIAWLGVNNATVFYGDLDQGQSGYGESVPRFIFDLANYPGGSFNVWFDVTYEDECGSPPVYQVRLDPSFINPEGQDGPATAPSAYRLHQNMPNPFNPHTTIAFDLTAAGYTELTIYNAAGQVVRRLWNGNLPAGPHAFAWDGEGDRGTPVPSGTYFYNLKSGDFSDTRRMVLVR